MMQKWRLFFLQTKTRLIALGGIFFVVGSIFQSPSFAEPPASDIDLVLIFDTSGSMNEAVGNKRKIDLGKETMWKFVDMMPEKTRIGLISFAGNCGTDVLQNIQNSTAKTREQLKSSIAGLRADGNTPIAESLRRATSLLANSTRKKRIVILTDGEETCDQAGLATAADEAWKNHIKVYAVGFALGQEPSANFRKIGLYEDARDEKQLGIVFQDIRESLEKDSSKYDEAKSNPASVADAPPQSFVGRRGHFLSSGTPNAGKLFKDLKLNSSFENHFKDDDHFKVLEHGYNVIFNEQEYRADKIEVLRVRLEDKVNFIYGGVEGFVYVQDVAIE
jgi:hypothetical protein